VSIVKLPINRTTTIMGGSEKIQSFQAVNSVFGLAQKKFAKGKVEPRARVGYLFEYIKIFSAWAKLLAIRSNKHSQ
jgi:hypothetical protein